MERVSLKMIAAKAGVSVSTVSLALRNTGTLSKEMTARVQKVATEMGYRPNPVLAALASKRFSQNATLVGTPIALLEYPSNGISGITPRYYRKSLETAASSFGYSTMLLKSDELKSYHDLPHTLYKRGVAGVVIFGQPSLKLFEKPEDWNSFAIAQCGRFRSALRLNCVRPNIFQAIKLAFTKAYQRGYRRIGFCFGQHGITLEDDEARFGTAMGMLKHLPPESRIPIFEGSFDDDKAKLAWIREHRPDVVIGFTSHEWYMLKDAGYRIPQDLSYIALQLDNYHLLERNIAGLCQQTDKIGHECVVLLDQMIRHKTTGIPELPLDVLLPSSWHEARSIREKVDVPALSPASEYLANSEL